MFGVMQTPQDPAARRIRAATAYAPLGFGTQLLCVCLFIVALVATARLVHMILAKEEPDLIGALRTIVPRSRAILLFSLKFLVVFLVLTSAVLLPFNSFLMVDHPELGTSPIFISLVMLAETACTAWFLMPAAVRLLSAPEGGLVSAEARKQGVVLAIVSVVSMIGLGFIVQKLKAGMIFDSPAELAVISMAAELMVNAPYILLFIALSIIASGRKRETSIQQNALP